MIDIKVTNIDQVFGELDAWLMSVQRDLEHLARGLATEAFIKILDHSPQYSGDFAANWKLSVGEMDKSYGVMLFGKLFPDPDPFINGDEEAIMKAMSNAMGKLDGFKLGQTIWISNSSAHLTTYAWKIENNQIRFRPGNYGGTIGLTMDDMRVHYSNIPKATAADLIRNMI